MLAYYDYGLVAVGFFLLILGAEALVHGGVALARRLNVSPLLIGVTIVAYGTSTPELLVSTNAALQGSYGIAVGNVVGSNTFNILFILGLTALIAPIAVPIRAIGRDGTFALAAALLFIWIARESSHLHFEDGVLFLAVLVSMIIFSYGQERGRSEDAENPSRHMRERALTHTPLIDIALIAVGIGLLVLGADFLVHGSVSIARSAGVSETVIGLTLVAAGTSLPELATSVVAALRGNPGIALGNITGSNIYNILAILGVTALIAPVGIDPQIAKVDMWVMLGATLALFPPMFLGGRMGRAYGLLLLVSYVAYVAYLLDQAGVVHLPIQ